MNNYTLKICFIHYPDPMYISNVFRWTLNENDRYWRIQRDYGKDIYVNASEVLYIGMARDLDEQNQNVEDTNEDLVFTLSPLDY